MKDQQANSGCPIRKYGKREIFTIAALGMFGCLLAAQNASAGTWYASNVNGPEPLSPQSEVAAGAGLTLFASGTKTNTLYEVWYASGAWRFDTVYSSATAPAVYASATYVSANNSFYVAHIDADGGVRLSTYSPYTNWTTQIVVASGAFDSVNTLMFQAPGELFAKLYIFYAGNAYTLSGLLYCTVYDGVQFTTQVVDGAGGTKGQIVAGVDNPAAVVAPGNSLRVYYQDVDHNTLREAYSPDGVNWNGFTTLDGTGGISGYAGPVGYYPSAIVQNGMVNVFYGDATYQGGLRTAQLYTSWHFGFVDSSADFLGGSAPVIHNNAIQVYYPSSININGNWSLKAAWGTGPGTFQSVALDGPNGIAKGALPNDSMNGGTAVEVNQTAPSVFYVDVTSGLMRNSYWAP